MKMHYLCIANETSTLTNIMATKEQVEDFLKRLKEKIKVFDINHSNLPQAGYPEY